jgi:hypothetical protein
MKIEINMDNKLPLKGQLRAVENYMFDKRISESKGFDETLNLQETPEGLGLKIETDFGSFYVSCKKTKGGVYKFETWLAI